MANVKGRESGGPREVKNAVQTEYPETRAPRMRSRKKIKAKIAELTGGKRAQVVAALRWVLGEQEEF